METIKQNPDVSTSGDFYLARLIGKELRLGVIDGRMFKCQLFPHQWACNYDIVLVVRIKK